MAKGWISLTTVNTAPKSAETAAQRRQRDRSFSNLIRNTKSLSVEDLKKQSDELYAKQRAEEDKLLQAFAEKKVKSKTAIKQALRIKKERAAAEKRAKNSAKQNTNTVSDNAGVDTGITETTEKAV